ncbi:conserved hypothetical protein [Psychromonas ingrahamii 37]|uniref:Uncharacterized protein n=1 Tax=Psychromonas ingrahamii (strain DSM 17664 / CCUG 51855 / 37) TaxID=357804 RepID=A1SXU8_PSYIN|nr:hypothetical protein [Psychromonas ingrahamii]ABM04313.1 conserved hypothetical protein [Psychromonas ingrahamii 37]
MIKKIPTKSSGQDLVAKNIILMLQEYIGWLGFKPAIHFELEGCITRPQPSFTIDYQRINARLKANNIEGELVSEFWQNQWEYVSNFSQQSPLKEAQNLSAVMKYLPCWFREQGIKQTYIKPVVWAGDQGRFATGSGTIFSAQSGAVHIPNAIQINISALNTQGDNIITDAGFGEYLQQCFLETSLNCALLYLPEPEAYQRLLLKTDFGLAQELCSPTDISGGHQGSIALYKKFGKHNQDMGVTPLIYSANNEVLVTQQNWQESARIEHRLGASSLFYNPFYNVIFALLNLIDALHVYKRGSCIKLLKPEISKKQLPQSIFPSNNEQGSLCLFRQETWFADSIDNIYKFSTFNNINLPDMLHDGSGKALKAEIIKNYQQDIFSGNSL